MKNYIIACAVSLFTANMFAQIDRSVMPKAGPAPQVNVEEPETFDLDNGLEVLVVENHKLPRVSMSLRLDNPPIFEGEKAGVASLMGSLLGSGTNTMSKDAFNERVDFLGARMNFSSGGASANTLSKYFPEILKLMADAAVNPNFTEEEFKKAKDRAIEGIKSSDKSVAFIASRVRSALAYGKDHPYGEFVTEESLESVSLADVKQFFQTYYSPQNAYLVIVGDVDEDEVKDLVKKNFADWKKSEVPETKMPEVKNVSSTQIDFVDMPNAVQSEISVVNTINLKKKDEDYFPVLVANKILGGGGEARLFLNLREDKGYTYGAFSSAGNDKYVSSFTASASVRNAVTDSSVVAFLDEIYKIREEKVSASELANAKAKLTGDFVLALEQPSTIANFAYDVETEDLDNDFYKDYLESIDEVSLEDVQRVAQKYFQPDNARIVIAGKGSEVLENLEKVQYNGKSIPIKYYDKLGNSTSKPEAKKMDASVTVDKVYENYIKAIGGKDAVNDIESVVMMAQGQVQGMTLDLEMKKTKQGEFMQNVAMGGNVMQKQVFNGEKGSMSMQGQNIPYTDEQIASAKYEANPFPELTVGSATLSGIEQVDGKDAYVVKIDETTKAYYDVESGLKTQLVKTLSQGGQTMTIPTGYSDYKEVQGVKFPYMITQAMGPQKLEFKVTEIKINEGINEGDFTVE